MATWTETVDNVYTTTQTNRRKKVVQQIYKKIPLYNVLMKKGKFSRSNSGGRYIEYPLAVEEMSTVAFIAKGDKATLVDTEFLRTARAEWRTIMGSLVRFRADDQQNRSKPKLVDLAEAKYTNLERTMKKKIEDCLFVGTGTYGANAYYGLEDWVAATSTNTVAGIVRSTDTWFANTTVTATTTAAVNLITDMRGVINDVEEYDAETDLIITTKAVYEIYQNSVPDPQLTLKQVGDAEYKRYSFRGIPIDFSPSCGSGLMYFLDADHIWFEYETSEFWNMTKWKEPYDQPFDRAAQIIVTGNIVSDMPVANAVLHTIA